MKVIRDKQAERFQKKLVDKKERLVEMMGYSMLPHDNKNTVMNVPESFKYKKPNGDSCIGYWEKNIGFEIDDSAIYHCPACGREMSKSKDNLDGAHVYKISNPDEWFFTPLCSSCNNPENRNAMQVTTPLVPVPPECYELKETE